jgi:hypothetical protein
MDHSQQAVSIKGETGRWQGQTFDEQALDLEVCTKVVGTNELVHLFPDGVVTKGGLILKLLEVVNVLGPVLGTVSE